MDMTWIINALLLVLCLVLGSMAYASMRAAPWVPAKRQDRQDILSSLELKPGVKFYDLGCGDGWLACAGARQGAHAVGYEISLPVYLVALMKSWFASGPGTMNVRCRDFWNADLSDADAVFVFLMPKAMERLRDKLQTECRPKTRVVSYTFPIPGWQPINVIQRPDCHKIWVYEVPAGKV